MGGESLAEGRGRKMIMNLASYSVRIGERKRRRRRRKRERRKSMIVEGEEGGRTREEEIVRGMIMQCSGSRLEFHT